MTMYNLFNMIEIWLFFGLLASLFERILIFLGLVRGNTIFLIIGTFIIGLLRQSIDPNGNLVYYGLFIVIVGPISVNRFDIITTIKQGRYWWRLENKE
jgi:hypothetical protein